MPIPSAEMLAVAIEVERWVEEGDGRRLRTVDGNELMQKLDSK